MHYISNLQQRGILSHAYIYLSIEYYFACDNMLKSFKSNGLFEEYLKSDISSNLFLIFTICPQNMLEMI